jgi:DNA modification methylase
MANRKAGKSAGSKAARGASPVRLGDLTPDPQNARRHNSRNVSAIAQALQEVGAARSIVIDERGVVLAGNATLQAAGEAGITKLQIVDAEGDAIVAVRRRGLSATQKTRLALFDNRAAELAEGWDADLLKHLQADGVSLDGLWTEDEINTLLGVGIEAVGRTDPDAVPAPRATTITAGDLFELGTHRLLCGDSTKPDDVSRLLGTAVPSLMVTDPPYGVEYDPAWRTRAGLSAGSNKLGKVANDDRADWGEVWRLFPGSVAYVWHAATKSSTVQASIEEAKFSIRAQIIWAKDRMVLSRGDYHWQHETCWYAVRDGKTGNRNKDRSQTTIWRISTPPSWPSPNDPPPETSTLWEIPARDDGGHGHGTQKPVECMARPMRNHIAPEVFEPFLGSGSTVIAGQMLGRRVYAIEQMPTYVQTAIDRWEAFTGKKATKVGDARPVVRKRRA